MFELTYSWGAPAVVSHNGSNSFKLPMLSPQGLPHESTCTCSKSMVHSP